MEFGKLLSKIKTFIVPYKYNCIYSFKFRDKMSVSGSDLQPVGPYNPFRGSFWTLSELEEKQMIMSIVWKETSNRKI